MESSGGRRFHKQFVYNSQESNNEPDFDLLSYINQNTLGNSQTFNGAFGDRKGIYFYLNFFFSFLLFTTYTIQSL